MIETFGDLVAMVAMVLFILIGFWMLYSITIRHREEDMKRREALYYRYYSEALSYLNDGDDSREAADADTIRDAYTAIGEVAEMMDYDSVEMVLDAIHEYRLPEQDAKRFAMIGKALKELNWEEIRHLLAEV